MDLKLHETPEHYSGLPQHHKATHDEKLIITASSLGTVFEWYDFYLYGLLTAIIAAKFLNHDCGPKLQSKAISGTFRFRRARQSPSPGWTCWRSSSSFPWDSSQAWGCAPWSRGSSFSTSAPWPL